MFPGNNKEYKLFPGNNEYRSKERAVITCARKNQLQTKQPQKYPTRKCPCNLG